MPLNWLKIEIVFPITDDYYVNENGVEEDEVLRKIRLNENGESEYKTGDSYINPIEESPLCIRMIEPGYYVPKRGGKGVNYSIIYFRDGRQISIKKKTDEVYLFLEKYVDNLPKDEQEDEDEHEEKKPGILKRIWGCIW
jgi:hypothetical protein